MKNTILKFYRKSFFLTFLICLLTINVNYTYASENESAYTIAISIPRYDQNNSEHFLISSISDWSHINDSDKRYFYVEPNADYGTITITSAGTESKKRYISLYNGNNIHPAKLPVEEQANVKLIFSDAHYWIVDRMSGIDNNTVGEVCFIAKNHSSNIVFNRLYLTNFYDGILIQGTLVAPYTNNITVQNSRLDPMAPKGLDDDRVAIILTGEDWNISRTLMNTKILNNEIRNCNDGIQLVSRPQDGLLVDYPGTIIDCNHIYVDTDVYTDGNGNQDPTGLYAWTENAIDLKGGSSDPANPMIISNNYMWGYRWTDTNGGGSGDAGTAAGGHYDVKNVIFQNNVIFDSNRALTFADPGGLPYSVENVSIIGNIMYNIGHSPTGGVEFAHYFYRSKNLRFEENTIVGVNKQSRWLANNYDEEDMSVRNNVIINSYEMTGTRTSTTQIEYNSFYNTRMQNFRDGTFYDNASNAKMANLTFTTDTYTNNPRDITLPGIVTTDLSPHAKNYKKDHSNNSDFWTKDFELVVIKSNLDDNLQKAYFYKSNSKKPRPLIVSLHTWSGDYSQFDELAEQCKLKDLNYIHPDFRGKNRTKNACCSELALNDIDQSITFAIENANIDLSKIYVVGFSGGGYATLSTFMNSKHSIRKFSAWGSISDLTTWYNESKIRGNNYDVNIIRCTESKNSILNENNAKKKSPIYWETPVDKLSKAEVNIYAGIYDGIQGSVPITQSINFYNKLLKDLSVSDSSKYVSDKEILQLLTQRKPLGDFGNISNRKICLRKEYKNIKLVIFEGNHEILSEFALDELLE